jgi:hypothetical protein
MLHNKPAQYSRSHYQTITRPYLRQIHPFNTPTVQYGVFSGNPASVSTAGPQNPHLCAA